MRCPDCNKMVSYDPEVEPEEQDELSVNGETVTGSYRRTLNCAECSTELKEYTFEVGHTLTSLPEKCSDPNGHELEVQDATATATDRYQDKDRNGKPIKSIRYMKHLYGVEVIAQVKCEHGNYSEDVSFSDEAAGSEFEELV